MTPPAASKFLSTLPARGATGFLSPLYVLFSFLSTLPARGATLARGAGSRWRGRFLSTLPARGATVAGHRLHLQLLISIHAPREGSDQKRLFVRQRQVISIHAPREGSDDDAAKRYHLPVDISIHAPREGSDRFGRFSLLTGIISIHAPREGSDATAEKVSTSADNFYPRSPRGERPTSAGRN